MTLEKMYFRLKRESSKNPHTTNNADEMRNYETFVIQYFGVTLWTSRYIKFMCRWKEFFILSFFPSLAFALS